MEGVAAQIEGVEVGVADAHPGRVVVAVERAADPQTGACRRHGWRIPEVALHGLVLAGGSIGGWIGLLGWRHKTRHPIFPLVLAVARTAQIALGLSVLR